jgi:tetratricopeptide (TPR) repeat protein
MLQSRTVLRARRAGVVAAALVCAAAAALPAPSTAQAQPAPRVDKKQLAKQYTDSGLAAQAAGDYDTAITFYEKAYEQVAHPVLLFNMAQAHRLAGRLPMARDLYRRYLESEPRGVQAKTARENLTALEQQLADADAEARRAEEAKQAEQAKQAEAEARAAEARQAAAARHAEEARRVEEARRQAAARRAAASGQGRSLRLAGMISGGVGIAGLGAGVALQMRASSLSDELSGPDNAYDADKDSDGKSAERLMYVSYAAGAALIVGGATLYFLGHRARASAERVSLVPAITPDSVGVAVVGGL